MAKDTNMSRCPEVALECKKIRYGSCVNLTRAITNSGFILNFDVDCTGFRLSKDQVSSLGKYLSVCMKKVLDSIASDFAMEDVQKEFDF